MKSLAKKLLSVAEYHYHFLNYYLHLSKKSKFIFLLHILKHLHYHKTEEY